MSQKVFANMVTIKVAYNDESRRFNVSNSSTWSELESQLRTLFKIPDTQRVIASSIDEDGDDITLSSDLELQEVIYQYSAGIPIRLVLTSFPADVEETATAMGRLEIKDTSYDSARVRFARSEPESTETETETEREGKYNDFDYVSTEEEAGQNSSDPEIYVIVANSRCSKRRPKFGHAKFESSEGFSGCPFMRGKFHSRRNGPFHEVHEGPRHSKESDPHGHHKCNRYGSGSPGHVHGPGHGHGYGRGQFHGHGYGRGQFHGHPHGHTHGHPHGHGHGHKYGRHRHCPLTPEELAEKVELLNSMGFPPENNAHYEELLKRFKGRIGRVVEFLLCERKRKDEGKDKESGDNGEDNGGETSAIGQRMEETIENKKEY